MTRTLKGAAFCALMLAAIIAGMWADAPVPQTAPCTTDTDCMERFGGDGGPYLPMESLK